MKIWTNSKSITLQKSQYKGAGGEGTVYVQNGICYKIYHTGKKCIPETKIKELKNINHPLVLNPTDVVKDAQGLNIGICSQYIENTEYLCKYFSTSFKNDHGITDTDTLEIVTHLQNTLGHIHNKNCLVVDYNEFNFLISKGKPYHIDVDAYQTPSYPATAIMDSIRDPLVKENKFSQDSDWFSFAVLAFQLYIGAHPYKGRHPTLGKAWKKLMEQGVSVFNPLVRQPPNSKNLESIPKGHKRWMEGIFKHADRSKPPKPDQILPILTPKVQVIMSTSTLDLKEVLNVTKPILATSDILGKVIYADESGVFDGSKILISFGNKAKKVAFLTYQGGKAVIADNRIYAFNGNNIGEINNKWFHANGRLFFLEHSNLLEGHITSLGTKVVLSKQIVSHTLYNVIIGKGILVQDTLDTCRLTIPTLLGSASIHIKELDKVRVLDAAFAGTAAVVHYEKAGEYYQMLIDFANGGYTTQIRELTEFAPVQLIALENGLHLLAHEETIIVFRTINSQKIITDSPLIEAATLVAIGNSPYLLKGNKLFKIIQK